MWLSQYWCWGDNSKLYSEICQPHQWIYQIICFNIDCNSTNQSRSTQFLHGFSFLKIHGSYDHAMPDVVGVEIFVDTIEQSVMGVERFWFLNLPWWLDGIPSSFWLSPMFTVLRNSDSYYIVIVVAVIESRWMSWIAHSVSVISRSSHMRSVFSSLTPSRELRRSWRYMYVRSRLNWRRDETLNRGWGMNSLLLTTRRSVTRWATTARNLGLKTPCYVCKGLIRNIIIEI